MATQKQIEANRGNAQKSTGPKTVAGKKRTKHNAIQHGMYARLDVLPCESVPAFNALHEHFKAHLRAVGPQEQALVYNIVVAFWAMQRGNQLELLSFENLIGCEKRRMNFPTKDPHKEMEGLGVSFMARTDEDCQYHLYRYQGKVERAYYRASAELRAVQSLRLRQEKEYGYTSTADIPELPLFEYRPDAKPPALVVTATGTVGETIPAPAAAEEVKVREAASASVQLALDFTADTEPAVIAAEPAPVVVTLAAGSTTPVTQTLCETNTANGLVPTFSQSTVEPPSGALGALSKALVTVPKEHRAGVIDALIQRLQNRLNQEEHTGVTQA